MGKRKNSYRPRTHGHKPVRTQSVFTGVCDTRDGLEKQIQDIEGKWSKKRPAMARLLIRELRRSLVQLTEK